MAKTVRVNSRKNPRPRSHRRRIDHDVEPAYEFKQIELKTEGEIPDIAGALNEGWRIYHDWPTYGSIPVANQIIVLARKKEVAK